MNLYLEKITQFKSPKVVVENEKFLYNFYSPAESTIDDTSFVTQEQQDAYKTVTPRKVILTINLEDLVSFNEDFETRKGITLSNNEGLKVKLSKLAEVQNISENLRNICFNERFNLNLNFYQENNIDLTFDEDLSFMYDIMTEALDTEEPNEIIPNNEQNSSFIEYSKKGQAYKNNSGVALRKSQKLGNNVTKNISYIDRLNKANNAKVAGFLDDKSVLNNKNYNENIFFKKLNSLAEKTIAKAANKSKRKEFISPKIFFSTAEYVKDIKNNDNYEYSVGLVVGYIIDKYSINENLDKEYLCSKFYYIDQEFQTFAAIEDTAIQYGKKYIYEFKTVHLFMFKKNENNLDFHSFALVLGDKTTSNIIHIVERQSPNIPTSLTCKYDKSKRGIKLRWGMPSNPQLDIFNFQVFRRESLFEPFTLIKEIRGLKNTNVVADEGFETPTPEIVDESGIRFIFTDTEILNDKTYIYAICAIDAHGMSSALSMQVACKFNRLISTLETDTVSLGGALKYYPNQFIPRKTKFFDNERSVINNTPIIRSKDKFKVYFTPDYSIIKNNYNEENIIKFTTSSNYTSDTDSHYIFNLTNIDTLNHVSQKIYIKN
tara:strand:- start:2592 stop:4397 length:1806 start_codon:yes stop_codon:yes gene_type:complete